MPLAAAEVMGAVHELHLMQAAFHDSSVLDAPVEKVMGAPLPTIGVGQPVALAVELLDTDQALLVLDSGRPRAIVSFADVLAFLSEGPRT